MKTVIQRVNQANVTVDQQQIAEIGKGFLVLLGVGEEDTQEDAEDLAEQIVKLRICSDQQGKMNFSLQDIDGEILIVPQFTLYADCSKGNRPSFLPAADPEKAEKLYQFFVKQVEKHLPVETGEFGAYMSVHLVNDGPVTIILES